ncbi:MULTISPECIES: hypothetical protein [Paraburkholderia]|uniref:DUF4402 domain-containing protein n=1 Tax=Paraburkholderia madseniana TaxID=2599607 RepID=A0AAP5BJE2_9BURK|nr:MULTISPECIES: hypothetical protein [Paraburkholderia]MCX4150079.1 hypothetical protein [Paraburkholderia madseniana]MDN7153014.1 hypothetical protein [Paraburkholderia sp. WS6]MDQ6411896.1 hypothetical protein [Paraburkholderia madseniana]
MSAHTFFGMFTIANRAACLMAASATVLLATPSLGQQSTSSGDGTVVTANISDSCRSGFLELIANAQGSGPSPNAPSAQTTAQANVIIFGQNFCMGVGFFVQGVGPIQLSATHDANNTKLPKSITASGQFPSSDGSDTIILQTTMAAFGLPFQDVVTEQRTLPLNPPVTVYSHSDSNSSNASGSLTVSTQNLGPLPLANISGSVGNFKVMSVNVTH